MINQFSIFIRSSFAKTPPSAGSRDGGLSRRAKRGELESDKKSDRGLCEVGEFVEVQTAHVKVRNFVHESSILGTNTEVVSDIEVGPTAVDKCSTSLPVRSRGDELIRGIEYERTASSQHIWPNTSHLNGNVRNQRSSHFMKVCLY